MLDIITLCSCACITTCLWCAVAALTCPRIVNVPTCCGEPGVYQSPCPLKYQYVQNWADAAPQMYPHPYCPNVPYQVLMCPLEYPSQNYVHPFVSSSTSSAATSTSDNNPTPEKSKLRLRLKKRKKRTPRNHEEEFAPEFDPGQQVTTGDSAHPPTPPLRRRRNRLKSILKSKFKKGESDTENPPQNPIQKRSVKESETEAPSSVHYESSHECIQLKPVLNRFHCPRRSCRVSRSDRSPEPQIFESRGCSAPKTFKDSNTSDVIFVPAYDSGNQTIFCNGQPAYIPEKENYDYDCRRKKRSFWRRRNFSYK